MAARVLIFPAAICKAQETPALVAFRYKAVEVRLLPVALKLAAVFTVAVPVFVIDI